MPHPLIIQGGMGVAVSSWPLARAVSKLGQLGVVSGLGMGNIAARWLQLGDPDGHFRRALAQFPVAEVAQRIVQKFYIAGGKAATQRFKPLPMPTIPLTPELVELTVAGNFAAIYLAKEGHDGLVGVNYMEKLQIPTLPSLYGALLAGVDYVLMGAGIPRSIPGMLDGLSKGLAVQLKIDVTGLPPGEEAFSKFDPAAFFGGTAPQLKRPIFLAIVSSATLAMALARKSNGRVDGFIIEGNVAGGHNAPPRGILQLTAQGEPLYGPLDLPDMERFRSLGLPFWLAGSYAEPEKIALALKMGAQGVQVGTAFAFCEESGIMPEIKQRVIDMSAAGQAGVFTDPTASPTGFPFKVLQLEGTLSDEAVYESRPRICDIGYMRTAYRKADGSLGYRCPAEPVAQYTLKGGDPADTVGRKCLCNGLQATVGLGQTSEKYSEPPIVTAGDEVAQVARFVTPPKRSYTAADVLRYLLAPVKAAPVVATPAEGAITRPVTEPANCV